MVPNEDA